MMCMYAMVIPVFECLGLVYVPQALGCHGVDVPTFLSALREIFAKQFTEV